MNDPTPEQIEEHDRRNRIMAPITAPLNWGHKDPIHIGRVLAQSEAIIARVLAETAELPEIDRQLALGAACPFGSQADRNIWIAEIRRQRGES